MCSFLPSVVALQNIHWNRRPASTNCMNGHMYALQRMQRTGPISPISTIGGSHSPGTVRAIGLITRPKGTLVYKTYERIIMLKRCAYTKEDKQAFVVTANLSLHRQSRNNIVEFASVIEILLYLILQQKYLKYAYPLYDISDGGDSVHGGPNVPRRGVPLILSDEICHHQRWYQTSLIRNEHPTS